METRILKRHRATIGMSGSGKTFTEKAHVEHLLSEGQHVIIIDPMGVWYGLRSGATGDADGFDITIFGGQHGDIDIRSTDGDKAAEVVLREHISAIIDLISMRTGFDQRAFMRDFIAGLRGKPAGVLHLIVDEADEFAPETPQDGVGNSLREDMIWIAKRGRVSGFVLSIITQRPADVSKSVLSQMQTLIVHQLIAPQDKKPVDDWLKGHGSAQTRKDVAESLAGLSVGERWIYSPSMNILIRGESPPIKTFDSSRTPEAGQTLAPVRSLRKMDLKAIQKAFAPTPAPVPEAPAVADVPAAIMEELAAARQKAADADRFYEQASQWAKGLGERLKTVVGQMELIIGKLSEAVDDIPDPFLLSGKPLEIPAQNRKSPFPKSAVLIQDEKDDFYKGGFEFTYISNRPTGAARRIVNLLNEIRPAKVSWSQACKMVGRASSGGQFNATQKWLRENGAIIEADGLIWSANPGRAGLSREQAVEMWCDILQNPAPRMIRELAMHPFMTRKQLGAAIGITHTGGNFGSGLSQMRTNAIAIIDGDTVRLVEKLPGEL